MTPPDPEAAAIAGKADYIVGDRVVLIPSQTWLQPWRDMSYEGRPATIDVITSWGAIKLSFDTKRKGAKPRTLWTDADSIAPALAAAPPSNDSGEL